MKHKISVTLEKGFIAVDINGRKFTKDGHRWKDETGGTAHQFRESLSDLVTAVYRYAKVDTRISAREAESKNLKTYGPPEPSQEELV